MINPLKTTIKVVSQIKLHVQLSPLKLDALLGKATTIQKKLKPNRAALPENTVSQNCFHVSGMKVCNCQACAGPLLASSVMSQSCPAQRSLCAGYGVRLGLRTLLMWV